MNFFGSWLRNRIGVILNFLLFAVLYFCVFALYRLPLTAVLYPTMLCALLGGILLAVDYAKSYRKHQILTALAAHSAELLTALPPVQSVEDDDYHQLIAALLEQQRIAVEQSDAKYRNMTDYYTVWAHQIKTPIAAMRLALRDEDSALSRRLSSDLFRIEQYVGMVLTFLRLDADSTDYVFRSVALDDVIRASVRKFAPEFISRRIRLEFEPCGAELVTDEKWLSFVIGQLLSNALKYTKEGGCVQIRVDEPLTLRIRDTGIGIAPADLPRIFEKGYTGFNGRSGDAADRPSSGIGLYLCRRVCRNLGAVISAESEVGVGTTVSVALENRRERVE